MDSEGGGGLDVDGPALVHVDGGDGGGLDVLPGCQSLVLLAATVHLQLAGCAHSVKGQDGNFREFQLLLLRLVGSGKFPIFLSNFPNFPVLTLMFVLRRHG